MVIVWRDAMGLKKQVFHSSENKPAAFLIGFLVYFVFLMACEKITDTQRHFFVLWKDRRKVKHWQTALMLYDTGWF